VSEPRSRRAGADPLTGSATASRPAAATARHPTAPTAPHPAATIVLLRPGPDGSEVLLIHRPATMAFGPGLHVFPGGRVDPSDADPRLVAASTRSARSAGAALGDNVAPEAALALHVAAIRELAEEAGVLLVDASSPRTDADTLRARILAGVSLADAVAGLAGRFAADDLAPIAHWTTPPFMPRRFSTWFFVADLPAGATPVFAAREVAAHRWVTPSAALEQAASGEIDMWVPTTSVLQRLIETGASTAAEVAARITMARTTAARIVAEDEGAVRFAFGAVGALPGRTGETSLIGRRELVLVDPGDPSDEALDLIGATVARRAGAIRTIVLTATDPDHAAAAEALAIPLEVPILVAPGAGRHLPYPTRELADGERLPCDADLHVRLGPPGSGRLDLVMDGSAGE
jgi:8-oxo-dGTP pyrophosphatase MutT (NUDIX family)